MFASNKQRRYVMAQGFGDKKAETMATIKRRWTTRNDIRLKEGRITPEDHQEEERRIKGGEYDSYIADESEFIVKNDIQLPPLPDGD
jgi:hypothetical protein